MNGKNRLYRSQVETRQNRSAKAKQIATDGEKIAARFLEEKSFQILERNFRASRIGEIDIVALDPEGILVFVEVKTRSVEKQIYGIQECGFEAVGYIKQRKILASSEMYMQKFCALNFVRWRYDVLVVQIHPNNGEAPSIWHVENAF